MAFPWHLARVAPLFPEPWCLQWVGVPSPSSTAHWGGWDVTLLSRGTGETTCTAGLNDRELVLRKGLQQARWVFAHQIGFALGVRITYKPKEGEAFIFWLRNSYQMDFLA